MSNTPNNKNQFAALACEDDMKTSSNVSSKISSKKESSKKESSKKESSKKDSSKKDSPQATLAEEPAYLNIRDRHWPIFLRKIKGNEQKGSQSIRIQTNDHGTIIAIPIQDEQGIYAYDVILPEDPDIVKFLQIRHFYAQKDFARSNDEGKIVHDELARINNKLKKEKNQAAIAFKQVSQEHASSC